jgi:hypothetical protein
MREGLRRGAPKLTTRPEWRLMQHSKFGCPCLSRDLFR